MVQMRTSHSGWMDLAVAGCSLQEQWTRQRVTRFRVPCRYGRIALHSWCTYRAAFPTYPTTHSQLRLRNTTTNCPQNLKPFPLEEQMRVLTAMDLKAEMCPGSARDIVEPGCSKSATKLLPWTNAGHRAKIINNHRRQTNIPGQN